jgi:hypothetical protein
VAKVGPFPEVVVGCIAGQARPRSCIHPPARAVPINMARRPRCCVGWCTCTRTATCFTATSSPPTFSSTRAARHAPAGPPPCIAHVPAG